MGHLILNQSKSETSIQPGDEGRTSEGAQKTVVQQPQSEPATNTTIDGISAVAALIIVSFAVDRFASTAQYLFGFLPNFDRAFPAPDSPNGRQLAERLQGEVPPDADEATLVTIANDARRAIARRHRVLYYFFAAIGAGLVAQFGEMGILNVLGFKATNHDFDLILTMLILTAGADRVASLLQLSAGGGSAGGEPKPVEVQGTLKLDSQGSAMGATASASSAGDEEV